MEYFRRDLFYFEPAFLGARAIVRTMHGDGEQSDRTNWNTVPSNLSTRFDDVNLAVNIREIAKALGSFAQDLEKLPDLKRECGGRRNVQVETLEKLLRPFGYRIGVVSA